jgi:hypothetical protein
LKGRNKDIIRRGGSTRVEGDDECEGGIRTSLLSYRPELEVRRE